MPEEEPRRGTDAERKVKELTLPDGYRVGIMNLNSILKEVVDLKLTESQDIRTELLKRAKACNYVAPGAENDYSVALFREYHRKAGAAVDGGKTELHKHTSG